MRTKDNIVTILPCLDEVFPKIEFFAALMLYMSSPAESRVRTIQRLSAKQDSSITDRRTLTITVARQIGSQPHESHGYCLHAAPN